MAKKTEEQQNYVDIIAEIEKNYSLMEEVRPLSVDEVKYFKNEFSISASHNSNAIEGNTFTFDEAKLLIERGIVTGAHSLRESEDIVGYKQAFDFLYEAEKQNKQITEDFIKKVHFFVLRGEENAGNYRKIQNYIGDMIRVTYIPCSPEEVPERMEKYINELQKDHARDLGNIKSSKINWIELFHNLAKHHIEFEKIHPFIDGNGRTGRLLLIYEMISLGLLPMDIRYEERDRYYAAIKIYSEKDKYSTRLESKTENMAKLLAESEARSMNIWLSIYSSHKH